MIFSYSFSCLSSTIFKVMGSRSSGRTPLFFLTLDPACDKDLFDFDPTRDESTDTWEPFICLIGVSSKTFFFLKGGFLSTYYPFFYPFNFVRAPNKRVLSTFMEIFEALLIKPSNSLCLMVALFILTKARVKFFLYLYFQRIARFLRRAFFA